LQTGVLTLVGCWWGMLTELQNCCSKRWQNWQNWPKKDV